MIAEVAMHNKPSGSDALVAVASPIPNGPATPTLVQGGNNMDPPTYSMEWGDAGLGSMTLQED
ncbi:MAG: hypothetical protein AB7O97_14500 [Planctomycetota bacterium]